MLQKVASEILEEREMESLHLSVKGLGHFRNTVKKSFIWVKMLF